MQTMALLELHRFALSDSSRFFRRFSHFVNNILFIFLFRKRFDRLVEPSEVPANRQSCRTKRQTDPIGKRP